MQRATTNPVLRAARIAALCLAASFAMPARADAPPVFTVTPSASTIKFFVSASVSVTGTFDKWNAGLTFTSNDAASGTLDIKIQAASVDTGSGLKNSALKGDDFFATDKYPTITFHSKKIVQTGPNTFEVDGDFTMRGVTKPEKLTLTVSGIGTGAGDIKGTMAFDRKDYGVNGSIPLVRIADRVEVTVNLKVKRVSGPPLALAK
jgi:polyisoprenoid-binding protein YceI